MSSADPMESARSQIGRRTFLLTTLLGGAAACAGSLWWLRLREVGVADFVASVVRNKLNFLQIEEGGLRTFSQDFEALAKAAHEDRLIWLAWYRQINKHTNLLSSILMIDVPDEQIAGLFLMSSDFFWHGSDETREVEYIGLYDPYDRPCANPFANLSA